MGKVKLSLCALCLVSLTAGAAVAGVDSPPAASHEPLSVVHHPEQSGSLEARWQWALAQIPARSRAEHVWIGFSTRRRMPENSWPRRWPNRGITRNNVQDRYNGGKKRAMFGKYSSDGYKLALPGIRMKTICYGARTLMTEFVLERGSALPLHAHPYEQTGYLVKGRLRLTIGGQEQDIEPGDCWCIPSQVEHGAQCVEDAVAVEVFAPVREDYLPQ